MTTVKDTDQDAGDANEGGLGGGGKVSRNEAAAQTLRANSEK